MGRTKRFAPTHLMALVQECLSDDLLAPKMLKLKHALRDAWALRGDRVFGHCYVASEALYHLLRRQGDRDWFPVCLSARDLRRQVDIIDDTGMAHWWLERDVSHPDCKAGQGVCITSSIERLDPTAKQFAYLPPYSLGVGKGFLTKCPSKRAAELIRRVQTKM